MAFLYDGLAYVGDAVGLTNTMEEERDAVEERHFKHPVRWGGSYLHASSVPVTQSLQERLLERATHAVQSSARPESSGCVRTVASDGRHLQVRQKGYAASKKKAPSLKAPYIFVGAKRIVSDIGEKIGSVAKKKLFAVVLKEWIKEVECGKPLGTLDNVVRNLAIDADDSDTKSSGGESSSRTTEATSTKVNDMLKTAQEFAAEQEKLRLAERQRLKDLARKEGESESDEAKRPLGNLPEFILWNVCFPSMEPDSGLFMGLFGTEVQASDKGQNIFALFRLDPVARRQYEKDVSRAAESEDEDEEEAVPGIQSLRLFARYVKATIRGSKSFDPVKNRFKLIARVMDKAFVDAGLGWLSSFNGKPKILRETVTCTYHKEIHGDLLSKLSSLLEIANESTSASSATKRCEDDDAMRASVFEIETDIMRWTKPMGIPLRASWKLAEILKSTIATIAFTVEAQEERELPERIIACFDLLALDLAGNAGAVKLSDYMRSREDDARGT